jgi:phage terminase large subunit-like protein
MDSAEQICTGYNESVLSGAIVSGKWIYAAAQRYSKDLTRTDVVMDWPEVEKLATHYQGLDLVGADSGKPFTLNPWQLWAISQFWGWRFADDGLRRTKMGLLQVARGNGKTTLMAGLALYDLFSGRGKRVDLLANSERQAELCMDTARSMIRALDREGVKMAYNIIGIAETDSEMQARPAKASSLDGLNPSLWIGDEAAEYSGRWLTKLTTTGAKRAESLGILISTPGANDDSIYGEYLRKGERVLRGEEDDDDFAPIMYGIDAADQLDDSDLWIKANPGIPHGQPAHKSLKRSWNTMKTSPMGRGEFSRYHAARTSAEGDSWLDMLSYPETPIDTHALEGLDAWIGLDLSKSFDLTAVSVAIPLEDGRVAIEGHYWWPRAGVAQRELDYRMPVQQWAHEGKITLTPGSEIDYEQVRDRILEITKRFRVRGVAFDPWGSKYLVEQLEGDGVPMTAMRQGVALSPGCMLWQNLWLGKKIAIGNDPIFKQACRNAIVRRDRNGNIVMDKSVATKVIDPLVAAVMAVNLWGGKRASCYEES